ncbi:MAG: F0F1 ATP synthase subunit A [bacterium]
MTLQFNDQMFSTIIITTFLIILCIVVGKKVEKLDPLGKTPLWLVPFIALVSLINNFTKENLGKKYKLYAPYIVTLSLFMFFSNISAVFLLTSPTSYLMVNLALALISFFIIQITGITSLGIKEYLNGFVGPIKPFAPLMIPINIIGELALPVSLSLRLLGNILSGAVLSKLVMGATKWWGIFLMPGMNAIFDILFGTIQVIVFVLLTVIFTSMKISDEDKNLENI